MAAKVTLFPPLKMAGGKRWLTPRLADLYAPHRHRRLVEPFVGAMAVALALQPERALLGDNSTHLIAFWRRLRSPEPFLVAMENDAGFYDRARDRFNQLVRRVETRHSPEVGELFYYLNRTCYNGLARFNRKGEFNVPFGKYKSISYRADFSEYAAAIAKWQIVCRDFRTLRLEQDDFIYADPPYDGGFTDYNDTKFGWPEQEALAHFLAAHPGPVVVSNRATERIVSLYASLGFGMTYVDGPRKISCKGERQPVRELLALRNIEEYRAPDALEGQRTLRVVL